MSNSDLFRIDTGLEIDEQAQYLTGSGAPGSTTATDNAPRGSVYTDYDTGAMYTKVSSGAGAIRWKKQATEDFVTGFSSTNISWREPVAVVDTASTSTAAILADLDADDLIQGVAVTVGMRILGANVTGNKNIFIVGGATGAWTLTEDVNAESSGDTVYVNSGTSAGLTFNYNGTDWVGTNASDASELGYIRTFIGKPSAGSVTPTYATNNVVTNAQSLETAIGKLDTEAGYVLTFLGKVLGNNMPSYTSTNWITNSPTMSVTAALSAIDAEIGANVVNGSKILAANKVNGNITALDTEIGSVASFLGKTIGVSTPAYSSYTYIGTASTAVQTGMSNLDAALTEASKKVVSNGITTVVDVDTVTGARLVEWDVRVESVGDSTKVMAMKIFATHNGVAGDFTKFATLKLGGGITGLVVEGVYSGGDLVLQVSSPTAVNVVSRRVTSFL